MRRLPRKAAAALDRRVQRMCTLVGLGNQSPRPAGSSSAGKPNSLQLVRAGRHTFSRNRTRGHSLPVMSGRPRPSTIVHMTICLRKHHRHPQAETGSQAIAQISCPFPREPVALADQVVLCSMNRQAV